MKVALFIALVGLAVAEDAHQAVDAPAAKDDAWHGPKVPPGFKKHNSKRAATCGIQTVLTAAQAVEAVTAHNAYRSQEPASDLRAMTWSDEMAAVAQGYANKCIWAHGDLYDCEGKRLGQNLYVQSSSSGFPAFNMTGVAWNWWNERKDYTYSTMACNTGAICGHFTQLASDQSYQVGCAYANCPTMNVAGATWNNCLFVVCDYTPPGNLAGSNVYKTGTACSQCDLAGTGQGFKCLNNLCNPCTPSVDKTCQCGTPTQACQNGGSFSKLSCSCQCAKGFYGNFCELPCSCADLMPDDCPGWKTSGFCTDPDYHDFVSTNCKTTCAIPCTLPPSCSS